jgi:hypothetical protein
MRMTLLAATALILTAGCADKQLHVGGMICPEGHTEEMVHEDFRECRAYDEKAAERASRPKLTEECKECLEERGYKVDGE